MRCVCTRSVKQAAMSAGVGGEEEEEEVVEEGGGGAAPRVLLCSRAESGRRRRGLLPAMAQRQWPTKWS